MGIAKEVRHGEIIPAWYGVAWIRFECDVAVCLPIPLNLIAAAARAIAIWMRHGYRAVPLNSRDAYAQGVRHGMRSNVELTGLRRPYGEGPVERRVGGAGK